MFHAISLFVALFGVWLLLSGIYTAYFLIVAAVCCALVVLITRRMDVVDREAQPVHLSGRLVLYLPWLAWQIVRANIDVMRRVLSPELPIDPVVKWLPTSQTTDLGRVIYANSITLTPGTVSTNVEDGRIEVHALSREAMAALEEGDMDARVQGVEG